jgi:glycine dehydrogenase subunit 2
VSEAPSTEPTDPVPGRVGAPVRVGGPPDRQGTLKDLSRPGRRAFSLPELDVPEAPVPADQARQAAPGLPEVAERDLVSHYTRLSQLNYGVDTGLYPLGSCSMKYNPKIAENVAQLAGFQRAHPHQPDHSVQGSLELMWRLERALCEITGMARATLQPPAGACGELTGLLIMRAHHERQGRQRRRVAIPDSSHGTNPASVRLAGYQALKIPSDARGLVDVSALEKLIDEDVAGLMLTNPNTLGMFEEEIERVTEAVHRIGGLVYYDGANLNAILGRCRPGDMGFDIVHINTHKTFATPHATRPARSGSTATLRIPSGACTASSATSACSFARTRTCSSTAATD